MAFGQVAGMGAWVDSGCEPIEHVLAGAGRGVGLAIGGGALIGDPLEGRAGHRRSGHESHEGTGPCAGQPSLAGSGDGDGDVLAWSRALERPQQRGLAGAVAAHERQHPAAVHVQVDPADGDGRAYRTTMPRPVSTGSASLPPGAAVTSGRAARSGAARRRASRTDSGNGVHPARRPAPRWATPSALASAATAGSSGKTTLLETLAILDLADAGTVVRDGRDAWKTPGRERRTMRRDIGLKHRSAP